MALYLVGTPIGNLNDITLRALETLRAVPVLIVEKYTDSIKLLRRFDIHPKHIYTFDDRSARRQLPRLTQMLLHSDAAYIVSAGMPGISDPAHSLVARCNELNIPVIPIPGPSAVTTARALWPFGQREFLFVGFLPKKLSQLRRVLDEASKNNHPLICFESPHRLKKTLLFLEKEFPDTLILIAKELTKIHEKALLGSPRELLEKVEKTPTLLKGEFTLVLSRQSRDALNGADDEGT